ncbi:MAG: hypothetical protein PUF37_01055 [Prevotellaceae bacterium]|nr:hypothetical protein [Prevotellaceae bacterium]
MEKKIYPRSVRNTLLYFETINLPIPFEVTEIRSDYYDTEEQAWCIDVFGMDDENGTTVAYIYDDGAIIPTYKDSLVNKLIVEEIFQLYKTVIFRDS